MLINQKTKTKLIRVHWTVYYKLYMLFLIVPTMGLAYLPISESQKSGHDLHRTRLLGWGKDCWTCIHVIFRIDHTKIIPIQFGFGSMIFFRWFYVIFFYLNKSTKCNFHNQNKSAERKILDYTLNYTLS